MGTTDKENVQLKSILDHMPSAAAVYEVDEAGHVHMTYISDSCINIFGYTPEEMIHRNQRNMLVDIHKDDIEKIYQITKDSIANQTQAGCIYRHRCKDRNYKWISLNVAPIVIKGMLRYYGVYTDISSEQEKAVMIDSLLNAIPGGVAIYSIGEKVQTLYSSEGVPKLSGRTMEEYMEWIGDDVISNTVYEADKPLMVETLQNAVCAGAPLKVNYRLKHKDGKLVWVQLSAVKMREEEGNAIYYAVFTLPMEESALYQSIVEDAKTAVYVAEKANGHILYVNTAWRQLEGVAGNVFVVGKTISEIVPQQQQFLSGEELDRLPRDSYAEYYEMREDGKYLNLSGRILNWNGKDAYIYYINDETEMHNHQLQQQDLIDRVPGGLGIFEIYPDNRIKQIFVNKGFFTMIGESTINYRDFCDFEDGMQIHPEDLHLIMDFITGINQGENHWDMTYRLKNSRQQYLWVQLVGNVVERDAQKAVVYCSFVNVDEAVRARQALEKTNKVLRQRFEQEAIKHRNLDYNCILSSCFNLTQNFVQELSAREDMHYDIVEGMSCEVAIPLILQPIPVAEDKVNVALFFDVKANLKKFQQGETSETLEYRRQFADGKLHWMKITRNMVEEPETGDILSFIYTYDINDDKNREIMVHNIINTDYEFLILLDAKSNTAKTLAVSDEYKDDHYAVGEDYNATISEYIRRYCIDEDVEKTVQSVMLDTVLKELEHHTSYTVYYTIEAPGGKIRRKKNSFAYVDRENQLLSETRSDVTAAYLLEQQQLKDIEAALKQANAASIAKSDFLSRMSHDIRTPMNTIIGMTALAREELDNKDVILDYLNKIGTAGEFLLGLVNDCLDLEKIENRKMVLNPTKYEYEDFVNAIRTMFIPLCKSKNIRFQIDESSITLPIFVDKVRFEQIFFNLLSNAVKFTPEGGTVIFRTYNNQIREIQNQGRVISCNFEVRDNGIGMSEEFQKKLFTPFVQESSAILPQSQGTGLGLVIVKNIVDMMGGNIEIRSKQGEGTTIHVYLSLPIVEEEAAEEKRLAQQDSMIDLAGKKILLVEDHPLNTEIAVKLLEMQGAVVTCAVNGKEAVDTFSASVEYYYDAILMDIRMPVMDGLEATRAIRALQREDAAIIPIIAMTANAYDEDVRNTKEAGMNEHLSKPIDPKLLYKTLSEQIQRGGK